MGMSIVAAKDSAFATQFNANNFTEVANMYNPGALMIPHTSDRFLAQSEIAEWFSSEAKGKSKILMKPVKVTNETSTLLHDIGLYSVETRDPIHEVDNGHFYTRWIKPADDWQIAFQIWEIGDPIKTKM